MMWGGEWGPQGNDSGCGKAQEGAEACWEQAAVLGRLVGAGDIRAEMRKEKSAKCRSEGKAGAKA